MNPKSSEGLVASIHDRLLNKAKAEGRPFQEFLQYYAMERFLYRLSTSQHKQVFILKGGLMLRYWEAAFARPTLDIDLLGKSTNEEDHIAGIFRQICEQNVDPDGLQFDAASLHIERITEDAHYHGLRIGLLCYLGPSRVTMQIDVGFGDEVLPQPVAVEYPTILDLPTPELLGYSKESTVAEKLEAMVSLGMLNSRMKDYYDLWFLCCRFDFKGALISTAIQATFISRETPLPKEPVVLSEGFAQDVSRATLWYAFRNRTGLKDAPTNLSDVLATLRLFLYPPLNALVNQRQFSMRWAAAGKWFEAH